MGNNGMTQSYNYNMFTSTQNFSYGYIQNFQWENGIMEFPISYVIDENGEIEISSRIDESTYEWGVPIEDAFELFFSDQPSTRVMTMILHSFSFLSRNESNYFYLEDYSKLDLFKNFLNNFPSEYQIVSASELQVFINQGIINSGFTLPLEYISHECHR
jgi:hypothetical protein